MSKLFERLDELEKAATPGPWEHIHIFQNEEIIRMGVQTKFKDDRPKGWMNDEANARLTVELRNAYPKLRAVVEAAKALEATFSGYMDKRSDAQRLRDALAVLEEDV